MLYLSPACVSAFGATAAWRGELGVAWGWSDGEGEEGKAEVREGESEARDGEAKINAGHEEKTK